MIATVQDRVATGAALLDEQMPDWVERIDLGRLDVESPCRCVLGQLFGDYADGWAVLSDFTSLSQAISHGFEADSVEYDELTAEWRALIEQRQAGGVR